MEQLQAFAEGLSDFIRKGIIHLANYAKLSQRRALNRFRKPL